MTKKTVLGMPVNAFYVICAVLVLGIIIGSFYDYRISVALSNTNAIGDFHQHYGNIISHLLYPVAGACLFKGLRKKGSKFNTLLQLPRYKRQVPSRGLRLCSGAARFLSPPGAQLPDLDRSGLSDGLSGLPDP